jgi:hypothetical protein
VSGPDFAHASMITFKEAAAIHALTAGAIGDARQYEGTALRALIRRTGVAAASVEEDYVKWTASPSVP